MGSQASSVYPWAQYPPGVTYNGGIPARPTQCGPTLTPLGGGQSDTSRIQAAISACPAGQNVQLGAGVVPMYVIGSGQGNGPPAQPTLYQQTNRQGNFDWFTKKQIWYSSYGGSGTTSTGSPQTLPNSMYLTSKPAFFGSMTWPWVDPSTGTTYTLPAKARFDAGTPNAATSGAGPLQ